MTSRIAPLLTALGIGLIVPCVHAVSIATTSVANHGNSSCSQNVASVNGATTLHAQGRVSGDGYCEYRLGLEKGQRLTTWFRSDGAVHAVVRSPSGVDLVDGKSWVAPADDSYVVRVTAIGGDRRGHDFSLRIEIE